MFTLIKYMRGLVAQNEEIKESHDEVNDEEDDTSTDAGDEEQHDENGISNITEAAIISRQEPAKLEMDLKEIKVLHNEFPDLFEPNERILLATVTKVTQELLEVKFEQRRHLMRIELTENIKTECLHEVGDRVNVRCYVETYDNYDGLLEDMKVIGVKPAFLRKNIKCHVLDIHEDYVVLEDESFISRSLLSDYPNLSGGDVLYVDLVESKREKFKWRGIQFLYVNKNAITDLMINKSERRTHLAASRRLPPPAPVGRWYNYEAKLCEYAQQVYTQDNVEVVAKASRPNNRRFRAVRIGFYELPPDLRDTYLKQYDEPREWRKNLEDKYKVLTEELTYENYKERFDTLLWLEEIEWFKNFRKYDCERAKFTRDCNYLALTIKDLAERRPSLIIGDRVRAYVVNDNEQEANERTSCDETDKCFEGYIVSVMCDKVLVSFDDAFQKAYDGTAFRVEFYFSRIAFRRKHHSSMRMTKEFKREFLFPNEVRTRAQPQMELRFDEASGQIYTPTAPIKWYNAQLNKYQKRAVYNVLRGETDMMPYIIYGPPGTGKTITLIETILQLVANCSDARLLVAAPSNSAANLICTRLIDTKALLEGELVRLVSYNSIEREQIPESLKKYCATVDMGEESTFEAELLTRSDGLQMNCTISKLSRFSVTVGTCASLGKYMELGFPSNHFTHVLIDEAGQCMEPEAMTVIGLVSKTSGQVILAGDPKQLPAIVINKYAEIRGLATSFLERLLETKPYRASFQFSEYGGLNPVLVTQLLPNYRALPSILRIYNYLSYEMKLQAMIEEQNSYEAGLLQKVNHILFPSKQRRAAHGSYFYAVRGENRRERDSPSWYNPREANAVFQMTYKLYGAGLKPDNIGIIAPYAKQCKYIRGLFMEAKIKPPKVGSVEEFQGQERDVILLSTVRTARREYINYDWRFKLGFIQSERRLNVAISRARALLIVLGDPELLEKDHAWGIYLNECRANDSYYGNDFNQVAHASGNNRNG